MNWTENKLIDGGFVVAEIKGAGFIVVNFPHKITWVNHKDAAKLSILQQYKDFKATILKNELLDIVEKISDTIRTYPNKTDNALSVHINELLRDRFETEKLCMYDCGNDDCFCKKTRR